MFWHPSPVPEWMRNCIDATAFNQSMWLYDIIYIYMYIFVILCLFVIFIYIIFRLKVLKQKRPKRLAHFTHTPNWILQGVVALIYSVGASWIKHGDDLTSRILRFNCACLCRTMRIHQRQRKCVGRCHPFMDADDHAHRSASEKKKRIDTACITALGMHACNILNNMHDALMFWTLLHYVPPGTKWRCGRLMPWLKAGYVEPFMWNRLHACMLFVTLWLSCMHACASKLSSSKCWMHDG